MKICCGSKEVRESESDNTYDIKENQARDEEDAEIGFVRPQSTQSERTKKHEDAVHRRRSAEMKE